MEWKRSHAEKTNCCREKKNKQVENVNIHKIYMRVCVCVLAIHSTTTTSTIWCDHSRNPAFNNKTSFMRDILNTSTHRHELIYTLLVLFDGSWPIRLLSAVSSHSILADRIVLTLFLCGCFTFSLSTLSFPSSPSSMVWYFLRTNTSSYLNASERKVKFSVVVRACLLCVCVREV